MDTSQREPRWAWTLAEQCHRLASDLTPSDRNRLRRDAWLLLVTALTRYLRQHARRLGALSREELEDLAAQKSLDLLGRCESGAWDVRGRSGPEVAAFLSIVARNGVVDRLRDGDTRRIDPRVSPEDLDEPETALAAESFRTRDPAHAYEAVEFARELGLCVARLRPRARMIWSLRVLLEWPSRRIAEHPQVRVTPAHVDVEFQRARQRVRSCMKAAGFDAGEMPIGTLEETWKVLESGVRDPVEPSEARSAETRR